MRCLIAVPLLLLAANAFHLRAEDADEVRERGIAALKDSQANPHAIVDAARLFVKAAELYNAAGDEEKNVEMNSFLYWCKKKMTLEDIDAFTKGGEAAVASKLAAVEKARPRADDAQKWFDRADLFAQKNPSEHLLIAIRFYEVADRFKGSDASLAAQDRSLKEQLLDKSNAVKTAAQPAAVKPADPAAKDLGKRPVPLADDIKMAEKLIKDLLKADFAKTDAASRLALVAKLLQQAEENKTDAASYYVLLHEARDLAVLAGDASKAAEVQNQMRDAFKQDFAAILLDLRKLEPSAKAADPAAALAGLFLLSAEDALAVENYDQAVRLNSHADDLLPLIKDAALKTRLKTEIPRVQALKRESVAALAAQKTLATKPDDAEANLVAGKFALLLGEVEKSMALLAKSKDAVLSGLAKSELSPPKEGTEQAKLADGWFDRAEKEGSAYLKARMQERAAVWYTSALPGLAGLAKLKVEVKMKGLPQVAASAAVTEVNKPTEAQPKPPTGVFTGKKEIVLDLGNGIKMEFVAIPAGRFSMGSPASEAGHEQIEHLHTVTLTKPFFIGKYAVTQEQYQALMGANPSSFPGKTIPVGNMKYPEAVGFCDKLNEQIIEQITPALGFRAQLPTEAQWEYAARAGSNTRFYWGNSEDDIGQYEWTGANAEGKTHPVGQKKPNAWGLFDMSGNAMTWCKDWLDDTGKDAIDPKGPESGQRKIVRGGSYNGTPEKSRVAKRTHVTPDYNPPEYGIRVVLNPDMKAPTPVTEAKPPAAPKKVAPGTTVIVVNASDAISKSGFTLEPGRFYQINVEGTGWNSDSKTEGLMARIGIKDDEFDSFNSVTWWNLKMSATTILSPPAKGELFLRIAGDKDKITGGHGKLELTIAEIPYYRRPASTTIDVECLYSGGWNSNDQPHVDFIFTNAGLRIKHVSGAKIYSPIRLNGVVVWLNGGKAAPLEFIGPLLKQKLTLKSRHADESITEEVFGEKLTVRVAGSHASFTIEP